MKMGWRRNGDCVYIALEQFADIGDGAAAQCARDKLGLLAIRIGNSDQLGAGQAGKHTSMIAAHDADTDNPDTQRTLCARYCRLHHLSMYPHTPTLPLHHLARHRAAGDLPAKTNTNTF